MKQAILVQAVSTGGTFGTATSNTDMSQRESLEETILNLATLMGAREVYKQTSARGALFYPVNDSACQSVTYTILELSRKILETKEGRRQR